MRPLVLTLSALVACACSRTTEAQPASAFPKPDRPVAAIVSPAWTSGPDRDQADETGQLVRGLGIRPGMSVADIGAGSGYHTVRLSAVVGPDGRVFAQDILPRHLEMLRTEVARRGLSNVVVVEGAPDDPRIPRRVDRAILVHMYHEIENPYALLWNLANALKPEARVGVIDVDRTPDRHGTPPALLKCEFEAVGYRQVRQIRLTGGGGYLAVFAPPRAGRRPEPDKIKPCAASPP
ncbi:class I SAM-dependent methyltransferase [Phenylobacterium sp.]|uniref:class I SAM-dependent methyltransferase n=1 Tax=Phenylobacterium sp. TaxID=1871053 RepID=UPI00378396D9